MAKPEPVSRSEGRIEGHALRPEIQALRALAVMLVVVFHLWPNRLTGGYVGVDVFFVISGFLITAHLTETLERDGRLSIGSFFARRIRRLLPASILVLVVVGVTTLFVLPQTVWNEIGRQIIASAVYMQNWLLAADSVDYLAANPDASPVQHFWSLSVEEQFYIFWPFLLVTGAFIGGRIGMRRRGLVAMVIAVVVASLAFSIVATASGPWAYFVTPTRAWEFGLGGLGALLLYRPRGSEQLRAVLSWAGLAAIGASAVLFDASTPFPGAIALLPVAGTLAVIASGSPGVWFAPTRLLSLRPVQFLGDVSYSLYLWHWPLIVFVPVLIGGFGAPLGSPIVRLAIIVLAVALAWLTKRLVEDRFRGGPRVAMTGPRPRVLPIFGAMAAGMALAVAVGIVPVATSQSRIDEARVELGTVMDQIDECLTAGDGYSDSSCFAQTAHDDVHPDPIIARTEVATQRCQQSAERDELLTCTFGDTSPSLRIALVGDSHANQWSPLLIRLAEARGWSLTTYVKSGCAFTAASGRTASCLEWNKNVLPSLVEGDYDLVITSAEGIAEERRGDVLYRADAVNGLVAAWEVLRSAGAQVLAIADTPWPRRAGIMDPPSCIDSRTGTCDFARFDALADDPQPDAQRAVPGTAVIDLNDVICPAGQCSSVRGGILVYRDGSHLTDLYSASLLAVFAERLDASGVVP